MRNQDGRTPIDGEQVGGLEHALAPPGHAMNPTHQPHVGINRVEIPHPGHHVQAVLK